MTQDEILAMEAGRGIDALIAEKVMGWRMVNHADWPEGTLIRDYHHRIEWYAPGMKEEPGALGAGLESCMVPRYSTDIAAAWDVVYKMIAMGHSISIADNDGRYWGVDFYRMRDEAAFDALSTANALSPELAICRAALLAVMETEL